MIKVTRLNKSEFYVNPHQIEFMECTPNTVITMVSGRKVIVAESVEDVTESIIAYRARMLSEEGLRKPSFYASEE